MRVENFMHTSNYGWNCSTDAGRIADREPVGPEPGRRGVEAPQGASCRCCRIVSGWILLLSVPNCCFPESEKSDIWCKAGSGDPRSGSHRFPGVRSVGRSYAGAHRDARAGADGMRRIGTEEQGAFEGELPFCTPFRSPLLPYRIFSGFGAGSLELRAWDLGIGA